MFQAREAEIALRRPGKAETPGAGPGSGSTPLKCSQRHGRFVSGRARRTSGQRLCYTNRQRGGAPVARWPHKPETASAILAPVTTGPLILENSAGFVAQRGQSDSDKGLGSILAGERARGQTKAGQSSRRASSFIPKSFNGRTAGCYPVNPGSNPGFGATWSPTVGAWVSTPRCGGFDSPRPYVIASGPGSAFPKHAQRVRLPPMTPPPWRRIAGSPSKAASRVRVLAGRPRGCRSMEGPVAYTHKMGVRFSPPVLWCCRSVVGRLVVCEFTGVRFSPAPPGPVKSTVDGSPYQRAMSVRIVHRVPRGGRPGRGWFKSSPSAPSVRSSV